MSDTYEWQNNSEAMFEALVKRSPLPMRPMIKKSLSKAIDGMRGDSTQVTEEMVEKAVHESTPKPFVAQALKALDGLRTVS